MFSLNSLQTWLTIIPNVVTPQNNFISRHLKGKTFEFDNKTPLHSTNYCHWAINQFNDF